MTAAVGRVAQALGVAGLLPAFAAACLIAMGQNAAYLLALGYPLLILSFLGGMWWGFAMRRTGPEGGGQGGYGQGGYGQGVLATIAVIPSLVALALLAVVLMRPVWAAWVLVATGVAILLTLPVDRHLARTGEAPAGWMRLRILLSVGLGGLTIVSGALTGLRY